MSRYVSLPLRPLLAAALLPARALNAALAIWTLVDVQQRRSVFLTNEMSKKFGLERNSKYRALAALEAAGLITVHRKRGQSPRITPIIKKDRDRGTP